MKSVVIRAPLLSKSGYGEHSRQIFKYLLTKPGLEITTQVVPWGITPWSVGDSSFDNLGGEITRRSAQDPNKKYEIAIQVQLPNEWDAGLANFNIGVTAGVETDRCNPLWPTIHCNKMDLIIVPSQHTKETIENSGKTTTPIVVIPECYFSQLNDDPEPIDLDLKTDFNFLTVGVLTGATPATDRKNLFYLLKWFVEEFKNDKTVGLIIKTNRGRESTIDRKITLGILSKILHELGHQRNPRVYLLHGNMSREEMNSLYRHPRVKALLSATRGEGFGLPMLEAAAAALPVIATNWSAHTEFLNKGRWIKVDYTLQPIDKSRLDNQIFVPGASWAEVSEVAFKKAMRKFRKSNDIPKKWAKGLSKKLKESHSESAIFHAYEQALSKVLT